MKSLLTDSTETPETGNELSNTLSTSPGMPGYQYLAEFVAPHIEDKPSEKAVFWAVNSIFSATIHMALMSTTMKFKLMHEATQGCGAAFCTQQLVHLGHAAILYAKTHRDRLDVDIIVPFFGQKPPVS